MARWRYHFEDGSREDVISELTCYQNEDGGFGHALEPDCWNPNSSPIQTWYAASILRETEFSDGDHPIIRGMLKYLGSGADFANREWLNTLPGNNDYPHAIWWEYRKGDSSSYNPTASLAGFILKFAPHESEIYQLGVELAHEAIAWYMQQVSVTEPHILRCFMELFQYLIDTGTTDVFKDTCDNVTDEDCSPPRATANRCDDQPVSRRINMDEFESRLRTDVRAAICHDTEKWATDYVCKPSQLFDSKNSVFYLDNAAEAELECDFIVNSQCDDGSYPVTWLWYNDYKEFEIAVNWWKSNFIIKNFLYLRGFGRLPENKFSIAGQTT